MEPSNDIWTAWNQEWGATVATILALIALAFSLSEKLQRLLSAIRSWRIWPIVINLYRTIRNKYRVHRAKSAMETKLKQTGIRIPIQTYASCLRQNPNTAMRGQLGNITPEKPRWLNDCLVATALESLAGDCKIVKARLYDEAGFPPSPLAYLFQRPQANRSAREEAKDIEINSQCAIYQTWQECPMEPRYERKGYSETVDPRTVRYGTQTWLKEGAPPCAQCWEKKSRETDIRGLVENITKHDYAETATGVITGANCEFQEAVIKVCIENNRVAELKTIKEIVKNAIQIRRNQLELVAPDQQLEWTEQSTEEFSASLSVYINEEAQ